MLLIGGSSPRIPRVSVNDGNVNDGMVNDGNVNDGMGAMGFHPSEPGDGDHRPVRVSRIDAMSS